MMHSSKGKKVLIVFPDTWLAYSPTVLNLKYCLEESGYEVDIVAIDDNSTKKDIKLINIKYVTIPSNLSLILDRPVEYNIYKLYKLVTVLKRNKRNKYNIVIGIDSIGYLACKILFKKVIFLSLEIQNDFLMRISKAIGIQTLLIQTKERKEYLIKNLSNTEVFYLPNSPINYKDSKKVNRDKYKIIYFGNIIKMLGVERCIESLFYLPEEYTLELHGIIRLGYYKQLYNKYKDLFKLKRLLIDETYIRQEDVTTYLSKFSIGICLYDQELIRDNHFNYISSPSGKLYNYYLAGLPVIGNDIIGLNSIKKLSTGVSLKSIEAKNIALAVEKINKTYDEYKKNAIKAAEKYDFYKAYKHFIQKYDKKIE